MSSGVVNNHSYISLSGDFFACFLLLCHSFDLFSCGKCLLFVCYSVSFLSFEEVRCPPIVTLKHILLTPTTCGENEVRTGAVCQLTCPHGYSLLGDSKVKCLPTGNWSDSLHKATCTGLFVFLMMYKDVHIE